MGCVAVQLVWERDGDEHLHAEAHGRSGQLVHVIVDDPRLPVIGLWVPPAMSAGGRRPVAAWGHDRG